MTAPLATVGEELGRLFSDMSLVVIILGIIGIALVAVEFFQPMHGLGVGCGCTLTAAAVVIRMLAGGTESMLFFMLFFAACIVLTVHVIMLRLHKREWLMQAVVTRDETDSGASFVGLIGVATTNIDGYGHIAIGDVNFYVTAETSIKRGEQVRVVAVDDDRIVVAHVGDTAQPQ